MAFKMKGKRRDERMKREWMNIARIKQAIWLKEILRSMAAYQGYCVECLLVILLYEQLTTNRRLSYNVAF